MKRCQQFARLSYCRSRSWSRRMPDSPKLFTEFPQNLLLKRTECICCLFGNKFVVDKLSKLVSTEMSHSRLLHDQTAGHGLKQTKCRQSKSSEHSWEFLYYKSRVIWTIALHFRPNIEYSQYVSTGLSVGIQWTILTVGHLVYLTLTGSSIKAKPCNFVVCTSSEKSSTIVHNNF